MRDLLAADRPDVVPGQAAPAVRPCPDGGAVQRCPFQCRAPSALLPKMSSPNAHTSRGPSTAAPASGRPNVPSTVQAWPFQRSARDPPLPKFRLENAQTLLADEDAAAMTCSLTLPGNAAWRQPRPVSCQAAERAPVPGSKASKAQAAAGPVAVMAVNCGLCFAVRFSVIRQPPASGRTAVAADAWCGAVRLPAASAAAARETIAAAAATGRPRRSRRSPLQLRWPDSPAIAGTSRPAGTGGLAVRLVVGRGSAARDQRARRDGQPGLPCDLGVNEPLVLIGQRDYQSLVLAAEVQPALVATRHRVLPP